MLRRDFHAPRPKSFRAQPSPFFELFPMRLVFDPADHEVGEVAEFVRDDVEEAVLVVDDFGGEFDGGEVFVDCGGGVCAGRGARFAGFAAPVGAAGGGVEGVGPDEFDAAGGGCEALDLALGDGLVELVEEGLGEVDLAGVEVFAS